MAHAALAIACEVRRRLARAPLRIAVTAALMASVASPRPARADVLTDDPLVLTFFGIGTLSAVASTVGAVVYAIQKRSFHSPWIPVALIGSAFSAGFVGAIIDDAIDEGAGLVHITGIIAYVALAAIPALWTVRGALDPAKPGRKLATTAPPPTRDPIGQLDLAKSASRGPVSLSLGGNF